MKNVFIIKADGARELFDRDKLLHSLKKLGTEDVLAENILNKIEFGLKDNDTTKEIYRQAFALLKKKNQLVAIRYSLKRAIAELGPSGFPFEDFIAEVYKAKGYQVATDQVVLGACVPHEVDVVAWNDRELIMIEAKFHSDFGINSDLKVALYIKSRFDDLSKGLFHYGVRPGEKGRPMTKGILITNTKFSSTAINYGSCVGLNLIGWNYPKNMNFHNLIEDLKLIPLTALTTLSGAEKKMFLANKIVLSKQLGDFGLLKSYGFSDEKARAVMHEVYTLCAECVKPEEAEKIIKDKIN